MAHECAGDVEPLTLAARQAHAAVAKQRVEPLRQRLDEGESAGEAGSLTDLIVTCILLAVANVLCGGHVQDLRVLRHEGDARPQTIHREFVDGRVVKADAARLRVAQAWQEIDHCRLAGAGRAHQRRHAVRRNGHGDFVERGQLAVGIGEGHVVIIDALIETRKDRAAALGLACLPRLGKILVELLQRRQRTDDGAILREHAAQDRHQPDEHDGEESQPLQAEAEELAADEQHQISHGHRNWL